MNLRVTQQTQSSTTITQLRAQQATLAQLQQQIGTGSRLSKPSDGPSDFAAMLQSKTSSDRYEVYQQTMTDSTSLLNSGVSALTNVNTLLARAAQIAGQGISTNNDPGQDGALASELDGIITGMLDAANTRVNGHAIFGGSDTSSIPFQVGSTNSSGQPTTITYNGSDVRSNALIGPQQTVDTRYVGSEIFQQPGNDIFQSLISLRDNLRNSALTGQARVTALTQNMASLEGARTAVSDKIGEQSAALANMEALQFRVSDLKLDADSRIATLQNTDYAQAIVGLRTQESAFEATLSVSARLLQSSLLDFIR